MGPIVCCIDGSEPAARAAKVARSLAERLGLQLVLLHIVDIPAAPGAPAGGRERFERELRRDGEALVQWVARQSGRG